MISQTFIRREVAAVEALAVSVQLYSLRKSSDKLVDPLDVVEHERTRVVLDVGVLGLLGAMLAAALTRPRRFWRATRLAMQLGARSHRGLLRHLIYLAESCVLRRWFQDARIDHVHSHFGTNGATAALLCRTLGGPSFSLTIHGACDIDHASTEGLDLKIEGAVFVVAICSFLRSQLYRCVSYPHWSKIRVVRCGLDADFLKATATPVPTARRLLFIGRLSEEKGLPTLIEAAGRLKAEGQSFELIVVGDGPTRPLVEELIDHFDLAGSVTLAGWQTSTQVRDLISSSRALVLPSFMEGLATVLIEAMALNRPVISTFVGGIPELVVPGVNGWLVPASSVEDLAAAMSAALEATTEQLERMGRAGAEAIQPEHNALTAARTLVDLFVAATEHRAAPLKRDRRSNFAKYLPLKAAALQAISVSLEIPESLM